MYQYISGEYVNVLRPDVKPGAWRVALVMIDSVLLEDSNNPGDAARVLLLQDEVEPAIGIHAHVDVSTKDCDGVVDTGWVEKPRIDHRRLQCGDMYFKEAVLGGCVHFHQEGHVEITPDRVEITQYTDEGYRRTVITWCDSECSDDERWYRDHAAEAAGY